MNNKWDVIKILATDMFGEKGFVLDEKVQQAYLMKDDVLLAILNDGQSGIRLHLRACLTPNMSGFLTGMLFSVADFSIGENFDVDDEGTMLFGKDALRFAAKNAETLWFGRINKEVENAAKNIIEKNKEFRNSSGALN